MLKFIDKITKKLDRKENELNDLVEKGKTMNNDDFLVYFKKNHRTLYTFSNITYVLYKILTFIWKVVNVILAIKMVKECSIGIKSLFKKPQGA